MANYITLWIFLRPRELFLLFWLFKYQEKENVEKENTRYFHYKQI